MRLVASRRVVSWRLGASRGVSGRFWESWTVLARAGWVHPPDKGESTMETPPHVSYCLGCRLHVACCMCDVSAASCLVVNLDVDLVARVNSIGRVVCCMSCVVCCAWCVVACLLIGAGLDFSTKCRSNFLCFLLRRGHNFLYFFAQNCASECLEAPRSLPGLPFGHFFFRPGPKMSILGGLRCHSGRLWKALGHPWDVHQTLF